MPRLTSVSIVACLGVSPLTPPPLPRAPSNLARGEPLPLTPPTLERGTRSHAGSQPLPPVGVRDTPPFLDTVVTPPSPPTETTRFPRRTPPRTQPTGNG